MKGIERGEYIDYVLGDGRMRERVERMIIEDRVESDHHPVVVWMKGEGGRKDRGGGRKGGARRGKWDEEGKKEFERMIGKIGERKGDMQGEMKEMTERIRRTIKRGKEGGRRKEEEGRAGGMKNAKIGKKK